MTAVAEKPKALAKKAARTPVSAVQNQKLAAVPAPAVSEWDAALFREAGEFLKDAAEIDKLHERSGESDRLLRIGGMIALRAAEGVLSSPWVDATAYDVAACINAARLIPGDVESAERTELIASAAERLAALTECKAEDVVRIDVPRPSWPPRAAQQPATNGKQFTDEQLKELHWRAYVNMDCARSVIFHYAEHANSEEVFALRDLLDTYCQATDEAMKAKETGNLSSGPLHDLSEDLSKILHLFYIVNDDNRDDGVLHGVEYLLQAAKRIADGDLGVLE